MPQREERHAQEADGPGGRLWSLIWPSDNTMMIGRPSPSQTIWSLESGRLWCARYDGEYPFFKQARRRAVGLQMGGIDHDPLGARFFTHEAGEDVIEYAQPAPADDAIIKRLVRAVVLRAHPSTATRCGSHRRHRSPPCCHPLAARHGLRERMVRSEPSAARSAGTNHPRPPPQWRL